jgi:hypothetical protein
VNNPEENTRINANEDTVIGVDADEDTIIRAVIDETVVGSVEVIDETVIGVTQESSFAEDVTLIGMAGFSSGLGSDLHDDTLIPDTAPDDYNTLISSLMDTSLGLNQLLELPEDAEPDQTRAGDTAPVQEMTARFTLRHINGTVHRLIRPIIFGRFPAAPVRGEQGVSLVVVASPAAQVSSTHARVEVLGDVVVVTDLRSTNGTRIKLSGQEPILLAPGGSMAVAAGAIIDLGDGNRLELLG